MEILLLLAVRFVPLLFVIALLVLLRKENQIAKGERNDFSEADRNWEILLMTVPMALAVIVLLVSRAADTVGDFLLLLLSFMLRSGILLLISGIGALYMHRRNEKEIKQPDAPEQRETERRQSNALSKKLRVVMPVMAGIAIAIAAVWLIWFRDQRQILLIAYAVYLVVGWIWLTWIILRNKKKETPKKEQRKTDGTEET